MKDQKSRTILILLGIGMVFIYNSQYLYQRAIKIIKMMETSNLQIHKGVALAT